MYYHVCFYYVMSYNFSPVIIKYWYLWFRRKVSFYKKWWRCGHSYVCMYLSIYLYMMFEMHMHKHTHSHRCISRKNPYTYLCTCDLYNFLNYTQHYGRIRKQCASLSYLTKLNRSLSFFFCSFWCIQEANELDLKTQKL